MSLMEWSSRLSVGIEAIDADHQALVRLVNELHDAVRAAKGKEVLGNTLDALIAYTRTHFGREEHEMAQHQYPGAAPHQAEHAALAAKVLELQAQFKAGSHAVLSMQVLAFLRDWLLQHIAKSDMALGAFLKTPRRGKVA